MAIVKSVWAWREGLMVYRDHTFPFPALMFIWCCPIKLKPQDFPWLLLNWPFRIVSGKAPCSDKFCPHSSSPDNIWHGADRQHDWCLPTTQDVPGISTSAEKAVPLLSLSYTALRWWLPCTANIHQAALIFIGTRSLQMYNAGCCRILSTWTRDKKCLQKVGNLIIFL